MPELVLVRHAQVAPDPGAPSDRWQLTPAGERAAARLREHPSVARAAAFFSSPEPKALGTALAGPRPVRIEADLRELDRGALGWLRSRREYAAVVEEILAHPDRSIRGCETAQSAARRVVHAIDAILRDYPTENVAVVSHGILLTLLVSNVRRMDSPDIALWRSLKFPDVAVIDTDGWEILEEFSGAGRRERS